MTAEGRGVRIKCLQHQDHPVEGCDDCRWAFAATNSVVGWSLTGTPDPPTLDEPDEEDQ